MVNLNETPQEENKENKPEEQTVVSTELDAIEPDLSRPKGVAWMAQFKNLSKRVLSNWFIFAPNRHKEHQVYFMTLHSLKEIEGEETPQKFFKQGTHGVILLAVERNLQLHIDKLPTFVEPALYSAQWFCVNDETAISTVYDTVDDICLGRLSPVSKERDNWHMRFGKNLIEEQFKTSYIMTKEEIN